MCSSYYQRLGATAREQREFLKLTQLQLAERARVSERSVRRLELGRAVATSTLLAVAEALDLSPADMLELVEDAATSEEV